MGVHGIRHIEDDFNASSLVDLKHKNNLIGKVINFIPQVSAGTTAMRMAA